MLDLAQESKGEKKSPNHTVRKAIMPRNAAMGIWGAGLGSSESSRNRTRTTRGRFHRTRYGRGQLPHHRHGSLRGRRQRLGARNTFDCRMKPIGKLLQLLSEPSTHHTAGDIGQAIVAALEAKGHALVLDA